MTVDAETDPFLEGRIPRPFIWGLYDGEDFRTFDHAADMIEYVRNIYCVVYAHNGGKFDFHLFLRHLEETRLLKIHGRMVQFKIGKATFRDSYSIIPEPLKAYKKTEIEYWKFEKDVRQNHMPEIISYLKDDCVYLHDLVSTFREKAGTGVTIAGNAWNFAKKLGLETERTYKRFDDTFRPFYFGGRTEVFAAGEFSDVNIYDIKSSYPYAMSHDHPTGDEIIYDRHIERYDDDAISRSFIDITCMSRGAFPLRDATSLRFPHCLGRFHVTGWEYLAAKRHGLINNERINRMIVFNNSICLKPYVDYWYNEKASAGERGDKLYYLIAKRMLNSLYGKFAQNPVNYMDAKIKTAGTPVDRDDGWMLGAEFEGLEIHERPALWGIQQKYGDDWIKHRSFNNVATGASITGFARAQIIDAMHTVGASNVLYCDTDSLFIRAGAPVHKLRQDGKLGAWDWEGFADTVHIAGRKTYALKFTNGPDAGKEKVRSKGGNLTYKEVAKVAAGGTVKWRNKAPTFSLGKKTIFMVRSISKTA